VYEDEPIDVAVEQLAEGLHVVRMPLPVRVDPVNCYLLDSSDGWIVVDCGLALGARAAWTSALAHVSATPADVSRIVITHFHPDHIGGAGSLAALTDAPVVASTSTALQSETVWGAAMADYFALLDAHLLRHGMPPEQVRMLDGDVDIARVGVDLPDEFGVVEAGDTIDAAGTTWRVVLTPGHADGHLCLHDQPGRRLLAGDHLLERISPAVGRFPQASADPLGNYLDSLDRVARLDVDLVLPGHGAPFTGARDRCIALAAHHERRLDACLAALRDGPRTAHEVALQVFGPQREPSNQRFAVTETLAHLELARTRGQVSLDEDDALVRASLIV
jgi:glyoxylase-like metal-dependent hydrolase (beta-lactamase superfamily II)